MTIVPMDYLPGLQAMPPLIYHKPACTPRPSLTTKLLVIFLSALLLGGGLTTYLLQSSLLAARTNSNFACAWHTVAISDTLALIARQYHTTISTLTNANAIHNPHLIFVGQRLCIPHRHQPSFLLKGIQADGTINWYDYEALEWSNRTQAHNLLCQVAATYHLPAKLLLAISWQESGWNQHVISKDGGIGAMQIMPYTAMGINRSTNQRLNPYLLWDNIHLGAIYLQWLWRDFHGNLSEIISAYNEGGWAVRHWGIFNWHYVNSVMALMKNLR